MNYKRQKVCGDNRTHQYTTKIRNMYIIIYSAAVSWVYGGTLVKCCRPSIKIQKAKNVRISYVYLHLIFQGPENW